MADNALTRTYNSFSGVDMVATFGGKRIGSLQGLSYTVQREKAPIYTMGSANPKSFSRAKRGIAGSVVFVVFDRSALLDTLQNGSYIANHYDIPDAYFKSAVAGSLLASTTSVGAAVNGAAGILSAVSTGNTISRIYLDKVVARPQYLDQVLPFDIVITAANEYGHTAQMAIHGVEILNAGSSVSIDDITTDEACTFVATSITPWGKQSFIQVGTDGKTTTIFPTA